MERKPLKGHFSNEVTEGGLIQRDWCLYKRKCVLRDARDVCTEKRPCEDTEKRAAACSPGRKDSREKQACCYLHPGPAASRTVRQRLPLLKPSVWQCVVAPAEHTLLVPHAPRRSCWTHRVLLQVLSELNENSRFYHSTKN